MTTSSYPNRAAIQKYEAEKDPITKFVNLCPHDVNLMTASGCITFKKSMICARVDIRKEPISRRMQIAEGIYLDVTVSHIEHASVTNLPDPEPNTIYLVSSFVASYFGSQRPDLMCPNTDGSAIKEGDVVTGVRSFVQYK